MIRTSVIPSAISVRSGPRERHIGSRPRRDAIRSEWLRSVWLAALAVLIGSPVGGPNVAVGQAGDPPTFEGAGEESESEGEVETGPETVLTLPPGEGNPRNSEGDFVRLKDGRLLFIYTRFVGGSSDHDAASLVSRVSSDGGATWSDDDVTVLENEGDWNVMSVSLLRLRDGRIAMFYLRKNSITDCRPLVRFSDDEAESWGEPVEIIPDDDIGYYVLNNDRVIELQGGRLVVPVALHHRPGWDDLDWKGEVMCFLSDDRGESWRRSKTTRRARSADGDRVAAQEPGVIELRDGRLMMWVRTDAGEQYHSHSDDSGETWSTLEPMGVASPQSPASIERIPGSDTILMVWNDHTDVPVSKRTARTPLNVAVSRDEGETWSPSRMIAGDPDGWYCYTAIEFVDDHVLLGHVAGKQAGGKRLATTRITRVPIAWCTAAAEREPIRVGRRAVEIHRSAPVIDGHNDLPWALRKSPRSFGSIDLRDPQPQFHTDIPRLRNGGVGAQFWSVYVPADTIDEGRSLSTTLEQIDLVERMVERYDDTFEIALGTDDIERIRGEGKIASLIGVEGGHSIENSINVLRQLYDRGARYMTLTHSRSLDWADSCSDKPRCGGLSAFGEEVVREMNRLGMLVDVSHVSPDCMRDALRVSTAPVIFSHSSARGVADHPRNVPDDVLRMLPENGGVVMINFYNSFVEPEEVKRSLERSRVRDALREEYPDDPEQATAELRKWEVANPQPNRCTAHHVLDHIERVIEVAGIDHVGLGSDYDGIPTVPKQLEDVASYPVITQGLIDRGYDEADIRKVLGGNLMRAFRGAEAVAAAAGKTPEADTETGAPAVRVTNVRRVFHNGEHNAFTDMVRFRDRLYLTFRSCPDGHMVYPSSSIVVLRSDDGDDWEPVHRLTVKDRDTRDPHFLVFRDELFVYTGTWYAGDLAEPRDLNLHLGYAVSTEDGESWSEPTMLEGTFGHYIWRAASYEGVAYLCGRRKRDFAVGRRGDERPVESVMLASDDGLVWRTGPTFQQTEGNEVAFRFDDSGDVLAVARRTGSALLLRASPPYREWERGDLGRYVGGPLLAKWGDRTVVGGRRQVPDVGPRTTLSWLVDGQLVDFAELPSDGDNSYPGLIEIDPSRAIVSWYSTHERDDTGEPITAIYLADLEIIE